MIFAELRLYLDRLEDKSVPAPLAPVIARALYVIEGSVAVRGGCGATVMTLGTNSGASATHAAAVSAGSLAGTLLRWELVRSSAEPQNAPGKATRLVLAAPMAGLMFIVIGNYLGKIRRNYMFGVRTPWTLASELSWNKTHRVTGKLFVVSGLLIVLASFWSPIVAFYTMMVTILGAVLFALIYSYLVWKRDPTVQTAQEVR